MDHSAFMYRPACIILIVRVKILCFLFLRKKLNDNEFLSLLCGHNFGVPSLSLSQKGSTVISQVICVCFLLFQGDSSHGFERSLCFSCFRQLLPGCQKVRVGDAQHNMEANMLQVNVKPLAGN